MIGIFLCSWFYYTSYLLTHYNALVSCGLQLCWKHCPRSFQQLLIYILGVNYANSAPSIKATRRSCSMWLPATLSTASNRRNRLRKNWSSQGRYDCISWFLTWYQSWLLTQLNDNSLEFSEPGGQKCITAIGLHVHVTNRTSHILGTDIFRFACFLIETFEKYYF